MDKMWGDLGLELASQMHWSEEYPDWHKLEPDRVISMEELGVQDKLVGFEEALTALKDQIVWGRGCSHWSCEGVRRRQAIQPAVLRLEPTEIL